MNADERRFAVLRAIVADYVSTHEPVGSKMIVDRHNLGVSSATVRNDMAVLEEDGLIAQPHTSAGRVPTDKGYRLFVDRLAQVKPLSAAERRAVQAFLDGAVDLDDVLRRSVRLLAQLTRQVAVVQYPTLTRSTVRHLRARRAHAGPADAGADHRLRPGGPARRRPRRGAHRRGRRPAARADQRRARRAGRSPPPPPRWPSCPRRRPRSCASVVVTLSTVLIETLVEHPEERLLLGGTANLTRNVADFPGSLRQVLEALEEQVVVLKLLASAQDPGTVTVRIGEENEAEEMRDTSVLSIGYGAGHRAGRDGCRRARRGWTTRARSRRCTRLPGTWVRS